jgi:hypothetical protein
MGGGNWGGVAFDSSLGYIFVNATNMGGTGHGGRTGGRTRALSQCGWIRAMGGPGAVPVPAGALG